MTNRQQGHHHLSPRPFSSPLPSRTHLRVGRACVKSGKRSSLPSRRLKRARMHARGRPVALPLLVPPDRFVALRSRVSFSSAHVIRKTPLAMKTNMRKRVSADGDGGCNGCDRRCRAMATTSSRLPQSKPASSPPTYLPTPPPLSSTLPHKNPPSASNTSTPNQLVHGQNRRPPSFH